MRPTAPPLLFVHHIIQVMNWTILCTTHLYTSAGLEIRHRKEKKISEKERNLNPTSNKLPNSTHNHIPPFPLHNVLFIQIQNQYQNSKFPK